MLNRTFTLPWGWRWSGQTLWCWQFLVAAAALVSLPVFIEAPLVRHWPGLTLAITPAWVALGYGLYRHPRWQAWGDLLLGFSLSWAAGAIYWGWWRWQPLWHLPIESLGVPLVLWLLWRGRGSIASGFYLGSLLGTAATDGFIFQVGLSEYWRQLMAVEPALAVPVLQSAIVQVQTLSGTLWAFILVSSLMAVGILALGSKQLHWYAFSGAVLMTIVVDSLFLLLATVTQSL